MAPKNSSTAEDIAPLESIAGNPGYDPFALPESVDEDDNEPEPAPRPAADILAEMEAAQSEFRRALKANERAQKRFAGKLADARHSVLMSGERVRDLMRELERAL